MKKNLIIITLFLIMLIPYKADARTLKDFRNDLAALEKNLITKDIIKKIQKLLIIL